MQNSVVVLIASILLSINSPLLAQNEGDSLFGATMVHDVQIYMSQPNYWDSLKYYYEQISITGNKTYMKSDSVVIDDTLLRNVGVQTSLLFSN